jgi:hypothetical protein
LGSSRLIYKTALLSYAAANPLQMKYEALILHIFQSVVGMRKEMEKVA